MMKFGIVTRLRAIADRRRERLIEEQADLARVTSERDEAVDFIERLGDVAHGVAVIEHMEGGVPVLYRVVKKTEMERLTADNARLREAVEDLSFELNALVPFLSIHGLEVSGYLRHISAAEAALKGGK